MLLLLTFCARTNTMWDSKVYKFGGPSVGDTNCRNVYHTERFSYGHYHGGLRRQCYWQNPCV
ncbi:hypothetical protein MKX01_001758 [Papaver californicum]|nr:hypothetical protein MKX01_001758 [Papaver californicum]